MAILRRIASPVQKCAWTVKEWCAEVSVSRATVNRLIAAGLIRSVTIGRARRITTPPKDFIAALE
jgi:excisionase family DNA binding protein